MIKVTVAVTYKYEKRIIYLLSRIIECCGEIGHNESVCTDCKIRIAKCSRLVKRGQIPLPYYMTLVRVETEESRKE